MITIVVIIISKAKGIKGQKLTEPGNNLWHKFFTTNVLIWVPSIDSWPCSHWARGAKVLFPGGCGSSMTNFYLLLGKELEGK